MASDFLERSVREVNKTDEHIAELTFGDRSVEMYAAWRLHSSGCHLFTVGSSLFARGNRQEREFAKGFVCGWRCAMKLGNE